MINIGKLLNRLSVKVDMIKNIRNNSKILKIYKILNNLL